MALVAALLVAEADRAALIAGLGAHELVWANSWRELTAVVRSNPAAAAVADLHAETRKDGVLRVFRFHERFPRTPIVVWGELDGRELHRLGRAMAADVVISRDADDPELVGQVLSAQLVDGIPVEIDRRLSGRIAPGGRKLVRYAAERVPQRIQVPDIASAHGMSVSTLERRFERWGLPTPGRLLLWLRVAWGLHWLLEPGRSVESVAGQLGYSSGAAFRRALKASIGARPTPLRNEGGLAAALDAMVAECPGTKAPRTAEER